MVVPARAPAPAAPLSLLLCFLCSLCSLCSLARAAPTVHSLGVPGNERPLKGPITVHRRQLQQPPPPKVVASGNRSLSTDITCQLTTLPAPFSQVNCQVRLGSTARLPGQRTPQPMCIGLRCTNIAGLGPCKAGNLSECSWSINGGCSSSQPVYPGSVWAYGIITASREPFVRFDVARVWAPVQGRCD